MKKPLMRMNKIIFLIILLFFLCGCQSVDNPQRIDGIINAVYTKYKFNKNHSEIQSYLQQKVENKEISEHTSLVIQKCLKKEFEQK